MVPVSKLEWRLRTANVGLGPIAVAITRHLRRVDYAGCLARSVERALVLATAVARLVRFLDAQLTLIVATDNMGHNRQTGVAHLHVEAVEDFVHFGPLRKMLVDQPEEGAGDVGPDTLGVWRVKPHHIPFPFSFFLAAVVHCSRWRWVNVLDVGR